MAGPSVPSVYRDGPLQSVRGDRVAPAPGQVPLPVPYALAGGGDSPELSRAFSVILRDQVAATKAIRDGVSELTAQVSRMSMYFDPSSRQSAGVGAGLGREELVSAFQEAFLTTSRLPVGPGVFGPGATPDPVPAGSTQPAPAGSDIPRPPYAPSPASEGAVPSLPSLAPGVPTRPANSGGGYRAYQSGRDALGTPGGSLFDPLGLRSGAQSSGFNLGGFRSKMAGALKKRVSEIQFGPDLVEHEGTYRWASHTGRGGQFASADEVEDFQKGQKLQGVMTKTLGDIAGGDSVGQAVLSRLPVGVGAGLGVAAAGLAGIHMASNLIENQQAQNAQYQRVLGGSNAEGMAARLDAQRFGFTNRSLFGGGLGGMGSKDAEALYFGATSLGLGDSSRSGGLNRGSALGFGQDNYSRHGMSVEDSMEIVRVAVENGVSSLGGVSEALDRVSKTAREAGVNAEEARKNFVGYYKAALEGGAGPNAATIGGALANMQTGLGPMFSGTNFSSLAGNPQQLLMQAGAMGMTRPQYMATIGTPGAGAEFQGQAMSRSLQPMASRFLGSKAMSAIAPISEQMKKYAESNGTRNLPSGMWDEIVGAAESGGADPFLAQQFVRQMMGAEMTPSEALRTVIGIQTGVVDPAGQAKDATEASQVQKAGSRSLGDLGEAIGKKKGDLDPSDMNPFARRGHYRFDNRSSYESKVSKTGMRSPIIEGLLKDQPHDRRFRVESADGPKVVDLSTAMKHYYDQLASGSAEIVQGPGEGNTVADELGLSADPNASATLGMDTATSTGKGKKSVAPGEDLQKFERDTKKSDSRDGRVVIEAAPELAALIRIRTSGAAVASKAALDAGITPGRTTSPVDRHSLGG